MDVFRFIALVIFAIVLPLFLLPIVKIIGYPEVIEEIAKALVIFFVILELPTFNKKIAGAVIFGFLFSLSETFLYLNNIFQAGNFEIFWQRLILTTPLHIITAIIILLPALKNKFFIFIGFLIAVIIHILFNTLISI